MRIPVAMLPRATPNSKPRAPAKAGDPLPVIEEYTYLNLKLNVGLTDKDFDHTNEEYNF